MAESLLSAFEFVLPTRIQCGPGVVQELALVADRLGIRRAFLVTDKQLREKTDCVARAERALGARLVGAYDEVIPDTGVEVIDRGAELARRAGADGIISVGGGSAIDTAKGIAVVVTEGGSIVEHQGSQRLRRKLVPHVAIPTTAGTGSEVSPFAVVLDRASHEKMHFVDERLVPDAALLDPELTLGLPPGLTAATGMDAVTHAVEAYVAQTRSPMTDAFALQAAALLGAALPAAVAAGNDLDARSRCLVGSTLSGIAMGLAGVGLAHAIAHVVGARHGVHHGTGNAIALPHVIRFNAEEPPVAARYRELARALGVPAAHVPGSDDRTVAYACAHWIAELVQRLGLPTRLRDVGVPERDLSECVDQSLGDGAIVYNPRFAADAELLVDVYRAAF